MGNFEHTSASGGVWHKTEVNSKTYFWVLEGVPYPFDVMVAKSPSFGHDDWYWTLNIAPYTIGGVQFPFSSIVNGTEKDMEVAIAKGEKQLDLYKRTGEMDSMIAKIDPQPPKGGRGLTKEQKREIRIWVEEWFCNG